MATPSAHVKNLIEKIQQLPLSRIAEVEDFVDFLKQRETDQVVTHAAMTAAEPTLNVIWDNPDDADYDQL
ncbi:MAG: DUF2281 domain-containing protein [Gammaproteobacteria bacterium]